MAKEAVVTRLHARVAALRSEFHHTLAKRLVAEFSAIGVEDLNVAGMVRNRRLARHIGDVGWSSFLRILDYKAADAGVLIVKAGRWFASSQRCSDCGFINKAVKALEVRTWTCPVCGVIHDRDHNAARNLVPTAPAIAAARAARLVERDRGKEAPGPEGPSESPRHPRPKRPLASPDTRLGWPGTPVVMFSPSRSRRPRR